VTVKPIRWFEVTSGVPPAFHNPSDRSKGVVCLNYKDHDDRSAGVEPWWLLGRIAMVTLIGEGDWGNSAWWEALGRGAQQMLDYADSDEDAGFKEGDFYGILWVQHEVEHQAKVRVGLAYASSDSPLRPVTGMTEYDTRYDDHHTWVTPQFAIPLQVEVQLPGAIVPEVLHRVSRYKRTPVI
jgi:hypothetical protein